jgi:hypothetical protein
MTEKSFKTLLAILGVALLGIIVDILVILLVSLPMTFIMQSIAYYFPSLFDPLRMTPLYNVWVLSFLLVALVVLFNKAIMWTKGKENK